MLSAPSTDAVKSPDAVKTYTFKTIPFEYRDCELWPTAQKPTAKELSEWYPHLSLEQAQERATEISARFDRLQKGIKVYLSAGSLRDGLAEARCTKEVFYRQLNRCLLPNPLTGEGIVGWAALISHLRLQDYKRVRDGAGTAGQFQRWISDNQPWREPLHRMIEKGNGGEKIAGRKPDVRGVVRNFIDAFTKPVGTDKRSRIPRGQYPHDGRSNARRAIERYVTRYVATNTRTTAVWFGEDIADRQHLGTGPQSFNLATAPFDVIGTDAHTMDCLGFIILNGPAGPQKVPVVRIQVVANLCLNKRLVSGYSICLQRQIQAKHVEEAYLMGNTPWTPKKITVEGLSYATGAGFPNGVVEGITDINPALIRLDNAAQHYAKGIRTRLRTSLGTGIAWGGVGHWWRNAITERLFGTLERYGFQRLPSSMGNGTQDPHRAENPAIEATGKGIEWDELVQLVDVLLANYNSKPHTSLGGLSPLDSLRATMASRLGLWIPRPSPPYTASSPRLGVLLLRKRIAGSVRKRVAPYVEVGEVRYTETCLSTKYDLIGEHVYVHVPQDMRTVECYLDNGIFIGTLRCLDKGWQLSAHSYDDRQLVNALIRKGEMFVPAGGDPVVALFGHLEKKAIAEAKKAGKPKVSGNASAAADLLRRAGISSLASQTEAAQPTNNDRVVRNKLLGIKLPASWE